MAKCCISAAFDAGWRDKRMTAKAMIDEAMGELKAAVDQVSREVKADLANENLGTVLDYCLDAFTKMGIHSPLAATLMVLDAVRE
jgi:hypothetical protein